MFAQSAQKFGEFKENDCLTQFLTSGLVQTANKENFYMVISSKPGFIFYEGSWKFLCFGIKKYVPNNVILFEEYDKPKILKHFKCNTYEQFQLVSVFSGIFHRPSNIKKTLNAYFTQKQNEIPKYQQIAEFVQKFAPIEKVPLKSDTIDAMLAEIFVNVTDDLRKDFHARYRRDAYFYNDGNSRFKNDEINSLLRNNPLAFLAEGILNSITRSFYSAFLDSTATDMKTLEELTMGWVQRLGGILLNFVDEPKSFTIGFQMKERNKVEFVEVLPDYPPCKFKS